MRRSYIKPNGEARELDKAFFEEATFGGGEPVPPKRIKVILLWIYDAVADYRTHWRRLAGVFQSGDAERPPVKRKRQKAGR